MTDAFLDTIGVIVILTLAPLMAICVAVVIKDFIEITRRGK